MTKISIKRLCEKIWELEDKYSLLNKDMQGVKVWQLSRDIIFIEIFMRTGVFTQPHTTVKNSFLGKIKMFPSYLYNSIVKNPLLGNDQKDILIYDHPRKVLVDGEYIDIYTKYLLDSLEDDKYIVIETRYLNKYLSKNKKNRMRLDYFDLSFYMFGKKKEIKFTEKDLKLIAKLEKEMNSYFDIDINLKNIFTMNIRQFKYYYKYYDQLIAKRKFKKIFIVVYYNPANAPLIAAAKANNAQVIEIQHGTISPYDTAYNFPSTNRKLEYLPDILYSFGDYWKEVSSYPIGKENFITYGFPYLREKINRYKGKQKVQNQIIFISQGTIGKELSKFAYLAAKRLKDYKFIYKLHPGEYARWRNEYEELVQASRLDNVEVIDNNKKDLYDYLAESEFQVGVYSTAIFEGLTFKCKTLLFDLPGIESMDYLIEKGIAKKIGDVGELENELANFTEAQYDTNYFFSMNT